MEIRYEMGRQIMKRWPIRCAAALVVSSLMPINVPALEVGVAVHLSVGRGEPKTVVGALRRVGFTSLRDDVFWSRIEKEPGKLVYPPEFSSLDAAVNDIYAAGGHALIILDYGNKLYDGGGMPKSSKAISAFARYASFVVKHFGKKVDRYEVWNEWNTGFGSNPKVGRGDAGSYLSFLKAVHEAVKTANPEAKVVAGAVAGVDMPWISEFIRIGGLDYCDAFSLHTYTLFHLHDNPEIAIRGIDAVHAAMAIAGKQKPVWVTEMGWPTNLGKFGVSEPKQAEYMTRFILLAASRKWITNVWLYDLIDDGLDSQRMEYRFGLMRSDYSEKPSLAALTTVLAPLAIAKSIEAYKLPNNGYAVVVEGDESRSVTAWLMESFTSGYPEGIAIASEKGEDFSWTMKDLVPGGPPVTWRHVDGGSWIRN